MPLGLQFGAQSRIVFDDAVVDHRNGPGAVAMGVGIDFRRFAVGGPSRMADAEAAGQRACFEGFLQVRQPAQAFAYRQRAVGAADGHSGGIISPVFQALQAFQEQGNRVFGSHVSDNAAHIEFLSVPGGCRTLTGTATLQKDREQSSSRSVSIQD